ncbi:nose resistant to fluoxetine protein 6-like [Bacillus rossius redtenbacheri]|uniref:nose resistant to fluoxetine protein 6-like n=1 Tax=Bacillus rossius redtenbacheri TaxID=93214 RepID=UPI002FDD9114
MLSGSLPITDANQHEHMFRGFEKSIIMGGALLVDFFFLASGTLLSYLLLSDLKKYKSVNLLRKVIIRFLRLTPTYMVVVFFHATVFHRLGSGPLWESVVGRERDRCQANWWTNLLYINNYVNADRMCMITTWYLAADTQLFIVCLLMVYIIGRWPPWGYALVATLSSLSVLIPFFNTWWRREEALFLPFTE